MSWADIVVAGLLPALFIAAAGDATRVSQLFRSVSHRLASLGPAPHPMGMTRQRQSNLSRLRSFAGNMSLA
jgi:hypothetical protein